MESSSLGRFLLFSFSMQYPKPFCVIFLTITSFIAVTIDYLNLAQINAKYQEVLSETAASIIKSGRYLQGNAVSLFEQAYAQYIGTPYCVSCASGLDALKLLLKAELILGNLSPQDEVLVPANTYIATILAITETGLTPVLVEPDETTLQIDDQKIEEAITCKTKAIMLVHLYGRCAMTDKIQRLCEKYQLLLFEDNAQAHGCLDNTLSLRTGSIGEAAAHSFYPGKNLGALGDAGAITTHNATLAAVIRALGNYGSSQKYVFPYQGLNSRMDELQAAFLTVKLKYLDEENALRRKIAQHYLQAIDNPAEICVPWQQDQLTGDAPRSNVFHIFPILAKHRDELQRYLKDHGVQTLIHYPIPPHQQACYKEWNQHSYPITEHIHRQELSLPCNQTMTLEQTHYVIDLLNAFHAG